MTAFVNGCTLELEQGDITQQELEVVVNAANTQLAPGGGIAGAIHRVAGPGLWEECKLLGGCKTGYAKITKAYNLAADYIIHTVGPEYTGNTQDAELLASCYIETLRLARQYELKSVGFPAISTGAFGYPMDKAAQIAVATVVEIIQRYDSLDLVRFVLFDKQALAAYRKILQDIPIAESL